MAEIATVGVVGLGLMGAGIVEVLARSGLDVIATEIDAAALDRGRATLTASTDRAVARGRLTAAARDTLLGRVSLRVGPAGLAGADLVIEAAPERLDLKRRLFADLDRICRPATILATNTSSLPVTEIARSTARPDRVVGLHFFNPAPVMKLVEVVHTVLTAPEVVTAVRGLCARLGKVDVTVGDRAGFVANALLFGYLNQAVEMYASGYAGREDIDAAMRLGRGLPMGPLALLDLIGLDTAHEILDTMYHRGGGNRRHAPAPLLRELVAAGLLGRKSGRGFYTYREPGSATVVPDASTPASPPAGPGPLAVAVVGDAPEITAALAGAGHTVTPADAPAVALVVVAGAGDPRPVLAALDDTCGPGVVFALTGSAVPVIDAAMATRRPDRVLGLRPVGGVVEVVRTVRTGADALATAVALVRSLRRHPVVCPDRSGGVVDALHVPYLNDAVRMLAACYAGVDDIDHAMTLGCGYPAGPFAVLDEVGLDHALRIQESLYRQYREPGLAPSPLLRELVTAGHLGRATGRGFRGHPR